MSATQLRSITRRYHALLALRFVPTGLMVTVFVLLLQDRGLSLAQIGLGTAAQGGVVMLLELPTGGLADAIGRKPVALLAGVFGMLGCAGLLVADTVVLLALTMAVQGVFRALDSGPLQAWYVDAVFLADPDADLERRLGRSTALICASLGAGALLGSAIVGTGGILGMDPLEAPILVALAVQAAGLVAVAVLVDEPPRMDGGRSVRACVADVPDVVRGAVRTIHASSLLTALVVAEGLWGFGMIAFETLMPPRLADLAGDAGDAATTLGPVVTAAWVLSAIGSAVAPALSKRWGSPRAGAMLRVAHGLTVIGMAAAAGPAGLVVAYLATYSVHGATATVHYAMVHRAASADQRATIVSANSLTSQLGGAMGGIALGALADATSIPLAMVVAAIVLAMAAPLYLVGRTRSLAVDGVELVA